jgi:hypothetical protein
LTARHDELGTSKVGLEKKERKSKDQIKAKIAKFRENRSGPARPVYAGDYARGNRRNRPSQTVLAGCPWADGETSLISREDQVLTVV